MALMVPVSLPPSDLNATKFVDLYIDKGVPTD